MMIIGAAMVLGAAALLVVSQSVIGDEEEMLKKAVRFDGGAAGSMSQGDLAVIEGKVSARNKILKHDFVHAAMEYENEGSWTIVETYRQPVIVDLAVGEALLESDMVCTRSGRDNTLMTDETDPRVFRGHRIRYQGLRRGDPVAAVGTLATLSPASVKVVHWYSGSALDYMNSLASNRKSARIGFSIFALLGAGLLFWGLKKRE